MEFILTIAIIFFDQLTKLIAQKNLQPIGNIDIIKGFFSLTYVENRGAAFGIFKNKKFLLVGITTAVVVAIIVFLIRNKNLNKLLRISFILIIAGAIGNLIDRVYLSYVVDYLHLYIGSVFDWPVFNIADMSVVTGTILLAVSIIFDKQLLK